MSNAKAIKQLAADTMAALQDAATLMGHSRDAMVKLANANKRLAVPVQPFNVMRLTKAASAVHKVYGDNPRVTEQQLAKMFQSNPDAVLDVLIKVSNDRIGEMAAGQQLGKAVQKNASEPVKTTGRDACREAFRAAFLSN